MDNNNKVIWITGASTGIGKDLAIKFAENNWTVAASARRENLLNELNKINPNIHSFPLDVTDEDECKKVTIDIIRKFKQIIWQNEIITIHWGLANLRVHLR